MGENKTPDLPVQIIKANGGPPLAVVPLPVLLVLADLARREVERAGSEAKRDLVIERVIKGLKAVRPGDAEASQTLRNLISHISETGSFRGPYVTVFDLGTDEDTAADLAAYEEAKARDEEALPIAVVKRLAAGEHPVKVFREHRRLTQAELAEAAGTTPAYLSQIETGKRGGSKKLLRALAEALEVDLADLLN